MACELSRDLILMSRAPKAAQLWLDREQQRGPYRRLFRFDNLTSPVAQSLKELYKIASPFGVHGHMHFTDEPTERLVVAGKEFVVLPPNQDINLRSFSLSLVATNAFM